MKRLAADVFQITGFPPHAINAYLVGDVLVDAGTRQWGRKVLRALRGRRVAAHALTHAHPDHQGASHRVCEALGLPLCCGDADAGTAEDPDRMFAAFPRRGPAPMIARHWVGPPHLVSRRLVEGDTIGDLVVVETPGHTPGHVAYWREADRLLLVGDCVINMHPITLRHRLQEPMRPFTADPALNRRSARRLAALEPRLVCSGHGPPLRDTAAFVRFVEALPG